MMKRICLCVLLLVCTLTFTGCAPYVLERVMSESDDSYESTEAQSQYDVDDYDYETDDYSDDYEQDTENSASIITDYQWEGANDGSLLVCETDGSFKYYRYADDLSDSYYAGDYEFYIGEDAVTYVTTVLSEYSVTEDELEGLFDRSEEYDESNFVCLVLNNEACIIQGENTIEEPYQTPYYGFCLEENGTLYLDIANMNTANYHTYIAK